MRYQEFAAKIGGKLVESLPAGDRVNMFINRNTGQVLLLSPWDSSEEWAAKHPDDLGISPSRGFHQYDLDHLKMMNRKLADAGWCSVLGFTRGGVFKSDPVGYYVSLGMVDHREVPAVLQIAFQHGLKFPDELHVSSIDAGRLQLDREQTEHLFRHNDVPMDALTEKLASNRDINRILDRLKELPYADRILVFGSVARGKSFPEDLDVWVDLRGTDVDYRQLSPLLKLANAYSGQFDPFVETDSETIVRNSYSTDWVRAVNVKVMKQQVKQDGKPLSKIARLREN